MSTIPNRNDVLFGRGPIINAHPGNQRYRSLVDSYKQKFVQAQKRKEKRMIAHNIIHQINSLQPSGRFLMEGGEEYGDANNDYFPPFSNNLSSMEPPPDISNVHHSILNRVWIYVDAEKVIAKVMHRLREKPEGGISGTGGLDQQNFAAQEKEQEAVSGSMSPIVSENSRIKSASKKSSNGLEAMPNPISSENIAQNGKSNLPLDGSFVTAATETPTANESCGYKSSDSGNAEVTSFTPSDAEMMSYLRDYPFPNHDENQELHEVTLREWTGKSKARQTAGGSNAFKEAVYGHVKLALQIALKLTEVLMEAEKDVKIGLENPIPLESIAADSILIRAKFPDPQLVKGTGNGNGSTWVEPTECLSSDQMIKLEVEEADQEFVTDVDHVMIMSSLGENPEAGDKMERLFALGTIFYVLFSCDGPLSLEELQDSSSLSINSINLSNEAGGRHRPRKKYASFSQDTYSKLIARLDAKDIPYSLCSLVRNLLDCREGDLSADDTYTSFEDVQSDLRLMLKDSSRFLDNIRVSPMPQLVISNKLYGRESEVETLEKNYQQHMDKKCIGVRIVGGAGLGKSSLGMHVRKLAAQSNGYVLVAKFDQNKDARPLSTIGAMFNELCDLFARDADQSKLEMVDEALTSSLGTQAPVLAGVVPSVMKLMPSCLMLSPTSSTICVDSAMSMRYLFTELIGVIASHSSHIDFILDDLQWADSVSLLLIEFLMSSIEGSENIFFTCCYRDAEELDNSEQFKQLLDSVPMSSLEVIKLKNLNADQVNDLVSDTLHLSPRLTRTLSSVLCHKTLGNPLFLRQLIESLKEGGLIYVDLNSPRWAWNMDKIADLKISDDVVALLIKDMERLHSDLQWGLKIASCLGSSSKALVLDILSKPFDQNLQDILHQVSEKGFMSKNDRGDMVFCHDKIQQAASELMSEREKRKYHMQLGLAICSHALNCGVKDDELVFTAVNQVNKGGPDVVNDQVQRMNIAKLNLRAGRHSTLIAGDFNTAFELFQHGISFLEDDHWQSQYELSIDLFDAAVESACVLNKGEIVINYSGQVVNHARCYDDKLTCLYSATKVLRNSELLQESMDASFDILVQVQERVPRPMGDSKLFGEIQTMDAILQGTSDDEIFNMELTRSKKVVTIVRLYADLANTLHFINPSLIGDVSYRMVDLTMKSGLCVLSPLAFTAYGALSAAIGNLTQGCRLGRLAIRLLQKKRLAVHKSHVICGVYQAILWICDPLQSVAQAHLLGQKAGQQSGDFLYSILNWHLSVMTSYTHGEKLMTVRDNIGHFIEKVQRLPTNRASAGLMGLSILLHSQAAVLIEGLQIAEEEHVGNFPGERSVLAFAENPMVKLQTKIHHLVRAVYFQQVDGILANVDISETMAKNMQQLNPLFLMGVFFEGLASFQLARERPKESMKWIEKGDSVLSKLEMLSNHSVWNFENKKFLLEAEKMDIAGNVETAAVMYERAIQSALEHRFIHEEGLASEKAGLFSLRVGRHQKALDFLSHSIKCYQKWGALAVSKRVESFIASRYCADFSQLEPNADTLKSLFASMNQSSQKRQDRD
mmetsp:Transcript_43870/g.92281  ORF Transcript_43870/g.92281 Transcript_43870/m.92281 type:complete len:1556 (+) Transcript_43870:78-4745(+)